MSDSWPTELRLAKDGSTVTASFDTGETFPFTAEYLRVLSPSAEVQGHSPDQKKTVSGKERVAVIRIEPVGNYAVKLVFDDMHDTGLYSWSYLLKLGRERESLWAGYLAELAEKGLSRSR